MTLMKSEFNRRFCIPYLRSLELCSSQVGNASTLIDVMCHIG